jgi:hypothetical protein
MYVCMRLYVYYLIAATQLAILQQVQQQQPAAQHQQPHLP